MPKLKEYDVLGVKKQEGIVYFYLFLDSNFPLIVPDNAVAWRVDENAIKVTVFLKKKRIKEEKGKSMMSGVTIIGLREKIENLMYAVGISLPDSALAYFDEEGLDASPELLRDGFGRTEH